MSSFVRKWFALGFSMKPGVSTALRVVVIYSSFLVVYGRFCVDPNVVLATVALYLHIVYMVMLNNYLDREPDRIAHPERALPSGEVSPAEARVLTAVTLGLALGVAALVENKLFVTLVAAADLGYFIVKYAGYRLPFVSILYTAANAGFLVLLGGVAVSRYTEALGWLAALLSVFYLANLTFCSIHDLEGDRRFGVKTFAVVLGTKAAAWIGLAAAAAGVAVSIRLGTTVRLFGLPWLVPALVVPCFVLLLPKNLARMIVGRDLA